MARIPFSSMTRLVGDTLLVQLVGALDERAELPEIDEGIKIHLNLAKVTALNSIGTRSWVQWLGTVRPPRKIFLEECPIVIVKSFSMVKGFLTGNMEVLSFYIPFYSDATGERKDVLMIRGKDFFPGRVELPTVRDSAGNEMEMDIIPSQYLGFLTA